MAGSQPVQPVPDRAGDVPEELDLMRQRPCFPFGRPRPDIGLAVEPRPLGRHEPRQALGHGRDALRATTTDRHLLHRPELPLLEAAEPAVLLRPARLVPYIADDAN